MVHPCVRVPAVKASSAVVIFLHGLGDSGSGWRFIAEEAARRNILNHVSFIFPNAPEREISMNFGMRLPAWYDIPQLEKVKTNQDEKGILESINTLKTIIAEEVAKGTPANRIVIGGFSQGYAISSSTFVTSDYTIGGLLGLSGYLPIEEVLQKLKTDRNQDTPVFLGHGEADNVIKFELGKTSMEHIRDHFGAKNIEWHHYEGLVHNVSPEEIDDIYAFLQRVLPQQ